MTRFVGIRGPVNIYWSACGTNFICGAKELRIKSTVTEDNLVTNYLAENGCVWVFNTPHAPHFGGLWGRMIGVARSILDGILLTQKNI